MKTPNMNLARVHAAMGETDQARDILERLQERHPESEMARKALEALANR